MWGYVGGRGSKFTVKTSTLFGDVVGVAEGRRAAERKAKGPTAAKFYHQMAGEKCGPVFFPPTLAAMASFCSGAASQLHTAHELKF